MPIEFPSTYLDVYPLGVVGEQYYQEALNEIAGPWVDENEDYYRGDIYNAKLIPENNNPEDKNAIRIEIDNQKVGYLSREDAIKYRSLLFAIKRPNEIGECGAAISGRKDPINNEWKFNVWLDIEIDDLNPSFLHIT